ncbi:replication initiator protein [Microviridae sp.]|nr:replication initiator protein [Microviridae sp.]
MPCRSPRKRYYQNNGGGTFTFNPATCVSPRCYNEINCGVCRDCRVRRARDWSLRCAHEAAMHTQNCWIHPTYKVSPVSVNRRDGKLLLKKLRNSGRKFKQFGVAEYGDKLSRPHMHICLFGTDFPDKYPWTKRQGHTLHRSPELEKMWPHGHILIGELTKNAAEYTAGYCQKKITGEKAEDHYWSVDERTGELTKIMPEQTFISPGLGYAWLEKYFRDVYPSDSVVHDGKEYPVPPGYDYWLGKHHPELWEVVQAKRRDHAASLLPETELRRMQAAEARDARYNSKRRDYETGAIQ